MIAVAVKDYDDENIVEDCEAGWGRFCAEVLVRTHYHVRELCRRHRRLGYAQMLPSSRKEWETLRRQVAAYRWAFEGAGGLFTFDQTCLDLRLDPALVRRKLLSLCRPERDINLLVAWAARQKEKANGNCRGQGEDDRRVGSGLVDAVRDFRSRHGERAGRRGAQTHAVCRYQDGDSHRR
jgi:hypothetical protein